MTKFLMRHMAVLLTVGFVLNGCARLNQVTHLGAGGTAEESDSLQLVKTNYATLPGWGHDSVVSALAALQQSCQTILQRSGTKMMQANNIGGTAANWQPACQALKQMPVATRNDPTAARQFIESWFDPYQMTTPNGNDGLFTGYYEANLRGSITAQGPYQTPLYQRPPDLVMAELGAFRPGLQGQRIAGRVVNGSLLPYNDRASIAGGALRNKNLEILWVDNPIDAFFIQVQGSGRVTLPDGRVLRLGYDGQNGYPYTAIGAELIRRGALTKDEVSLASIRQWLTAHPDQAANVMATNKSYVFFKVLDQDLAGNPLGASGVGLTPEASLAVDPRFVPYGAPVWLSTTDPLQNKPLQKLLIAQDTGGAIHGPVRGDVFWGYGPQAEAMAGAMKQRGQAWLLLPKQTDGALSVTLPRVDTPRS